MSDRKPIGAFNIMECHPDYEWCAVAEVRELEAYTTELEKSVNYLKIAHDEHVKEQYKTSFTIGQMESEIESRGRANTELENKLKIAVDALRDIYVNYDCDSDAHKNHTSCRCCSANEALKQINGGDER